MLFFRFDSKIMDIWLCNCCYTNNISTECTRCNVKKSTFDEWCKCFNPNSQYGLFCFENFWGCLICHEYNSYDVSKCKRCAFQVPKSDKEFRENFVLSKQMLYYQEGIVL